MPQQDAGEPGASVVDLAEVPAPATRVRFLVLASVCVLAVITYIHRAGFGSNSPELLRELDMDVRDLSAMTVAFMLAYGIFEVPWGRLGDRFGARNILAIIALGGSLMTAGLAAVVLLPRTYAVQLGFLLALRFLFGMFQAGTFPVLSRMMADWMPTTERGSAQGLIWMCSRAGGVLAPMVMVWLFQTAGRLAVAAGPRRRPRGDLVPGRLALAAGPARGDAPGQRGRTQADQSGAGGSEAGWVGLDALEGDPPIVERLGPVRDVRVPRLQRQLLPVPVRQLPPGIPPSRQGQRPAG